MPWPDSNVYIITRWRADDIFDLLRPAASLSLGQELHLAEGTSQSLEQQFGTIFRPICDSTRSHCCHLDKNWNSICLSHERTWGILFKSRYTNVRIIIIIVHVLECDVWCVCRSADGLYMQDIESSLYHSFWSEIPSSRNIFHHRALSALKAYVEVLSKVLSSTLLSDTFSLSLHLH